MIRFDIRGLALLVATGSFALGCGGEDLGRVGDPCEEGGDCVDGLYCFHASADSGGECLEPPDDCPSPPTCDCEALLETCVDAVVSGCVQANDLPPTVKCS